MLDQNVCRYSRLKEMISFFFVSFFPKIIHLEKGSVICDCTFRRFKKSDFFYVLFSRASIPSTCLSYLRLHRVAATRSSHTAIPSHLRAKSGVGGRRPHPETGRVLLLLEMKHCR